MTRIIYTKNILLPALFLLFSISACSDNKLTEAQSVIAGYCITFLGAAGDLELAELMASINNHVTERGYNKAGVEAGATRASNLIKQKGGSYYKVSDKQINECRNVLSW